MNSADLKRFFSKVYRELGGCWIWTGSKCFWNKEPWDGGYGLFKAGGKCHRAHKWIYEKLVGRVPKRKKLLHTCDTRSCVNIWHLYPDTQRANVMDMIRKGRMKLFGKEMGS